MDNVGHEGVAAAVDLVPAAFAPDRGRRGDRAKPIRGAVLIGRHDHRPLRAVPLDQRGRSVDVDDAAVIDDRHPVAEALGFLHQVGRQEHGLAALADPAHQIPDRPPRLRIEAGRQLVQEHDLRVVHQRQGDEQPLLLSARQRHEPGVALVVESELPEQRLAVDRGRIERSPEGDRLPHLDPLL